MHLYNLTLQSASAVQKALYGNFTGSKSHYILICRGKTLELYRIDESGKLVLILTYQLFCITRSIVTLRFVGMDHDLIVIGSDSGRVVILYYQHDVKRFAKTHEETFGKTGCRRIVPGQYLAVDPRGRAFMIAAIEKEKFVYTLNRYNNKLIISSPRYAHKSHSLCLDVCALDVGEENAMFACLEIDYGETEDKNSLVVKGGVRKSVVLYEMDFGMNNVIRKKEFEVPEDAHMLIAVPGASEGPGGFLIVCEEYMIYKGTKSDKVIGFPKRIGRPTGRKTMTINHALIKHRDKFFFFLLQSYLGDIFRVSFSLSDNNRSEIFNIEVYYFDTTSPCLSLCISRNGFLFCAAYRGPHFCYQLIKSDGKYQKTITNLSTDLKSDVEFYVRDLTNLRYTDHLDNISCPTDLQVADLRDEGMSQIYLLSGSGCRSSLRIIKQGLEVREIVSKKLGKFLGVWTLKAQLSHKYHKYMVLSLTNLTIVLMIMETGNVVYEKNSGIDGSCQTIHIGVFKDGSIIQVVPNGLRHIKNKVDKMNFDGKILRAASNEKQLVLALAGGDMIYYELDESGSLSEVTSTTLDSYVSSLDIGPVPSGKQRSNFMAVGMSDHTTRIIDLSEPNLRKLSIQTFPCAVESVCVLEMQNDEIGDQEGRSQLYVYVGLSSGLLMRASIDQVTGSMGDSRARFLGTKPVKCVRTEVLGRPALLALSTRPWLIYNYMYKYTTSLLSCPGLDFAAPLSIAAKYNGLVGLSDNNMKIFNIETFGDLFHSYTVPLDYTPRKMIVSDKKLIILEYDHRTYDKETYKKMEDYFNRNGVPKSRIGQIFAPAHNYYGHIRVYHPKTKKYQIVKLEDGYICVSVTKLPVKAENREYICVGCVRGLVTRPKKSFIYATIHTYTWYNDHLVLMHKTQVEDIPLAVHGWADKIVAGIGDSLRAYEIGKKKLLRKAYLKSLNSPVNAIHSFGYRIFATEVADSFHVYKYKPKYQTFYDIADDILPRYMTSSALIDYHTIIGGDKFESIFVSRAPSNAEEDYYNNPNSYKFRWENGYLNGAPFKMYQICNFFVGEVVTCIQKTQLASIGSELIVYATANGSICALYPFDNREDIDFFTHLELFMKAEIKPLGGRYHTGFRSFYSPCKGILDGDLCYLYGRLPLSSQNKLSSLLYRYPLEIHKKLEEIRSKVI